MNVLSLFDGISGAQVALNKSSINVDNYYASEIDKYAIAITNYNYPNTIQLGNIEQLKYLNIDLIIGGSPCQGFSLAGKQLNFNDTRSKLFYEYLRLIKLCNPKYFILENVYMKKEYRDVISKELGVECICINSSLVSGQNRKRLYWTNIQNIQQPINKNIIVKDILELNNVNTYFYKGKRNIVFKDIAGSLDQLGYLELNNQDGRIYGINKKSVTLTCTGNNGYYLTALGLRKLSSIECERLQTIPDNYTKYGIFNNVITSISNTQRKKCLGNSFTIDVISHILNNIN